jgi:Phage integrase family.
MNEPKLIADHTEILPELAPAPLKKAATLSNLWGTFVESKNPAPNTTHNLRFIGKRFLGYFREQELTVQSMVNWCKYVRSIKNNSGKPISASRVHDIQCKVRSFLKFIQKLGFIKHPLWEFVEIPRMPDPKMPEIVSDEEYQRLKDFLKDAERWQWVLWMCILGYRTGMNLQDCAHLRWENVFLNDTSESYIDIPRIKLERFGEKAVCRIPIVPGSDVHEWLLKLRKVENYKRADGLNYVHQDCPGLYSWGQPCGQRMGRSIVSLFRQCGINNGKSFASFRRTFVSNLVNSGMDYALVCKITGHTNIKMLLRYLRPDRRALQDGVMKAQQYAEERT